MTPHARIAASAGRRVRWRAPRGLRCLGALALAAALHAAPVISEFCASNQRALADGFGDFPDWIEVHNPDVTPVSLAGFHLTDDPGNLTRWRIPDISLPAGGFLVFFASGRDVRDPAGDWHTSFRLDADGEYLALVAPDGATVLSAFGTGTADYPPQYEDISYGRRERSTTTDLIRDDFPARLWVPDDDRWQQAWTGGTPAFNDSTWFRVEAAIGYDLGTDPGITAPRLYWPLDTASRGRTPDLAGDLPGTVIDATLTAGRMGNALHFDGEDDHVLLDAFLPLQAPDAFTVSLWFNRHADHAGEASDSNHAVNNVLLAHSSNAVNDNLEIGSEGGFLEFYFDTVELDGPSPSLRVAAGLQNDRWYHLAFTYDRNAASEVRVYLDGELLAEQAGWGGAFDVSTAPLTLGLARPDRELWADFEGDMDEVAIWDRALPPAHVRALARGASPLSLNGFGSRIRSDVEAVLHGVNSSAYLRIPFTVDDATGWARLDLEMQYDAGFVAYLNGLEIARNNAPAAPGWSGVAPAERADLDAVQWARFPLALPPNLLRTGENLLAIHGLNSAPDDEDFLLAVRLVATDVGEPEPVYFARPTPGGPNTDGLLGFVRPVGFSVPRGFYEEPFSVRLATSTPDAEIYFTTDGSEPGPANGTRYTAPVTITTTTVLQAAAFKPEHAPASAVAHTYLFLDDVLRQPADPSGFPGTWTTQDADYAMDARIVDDPRYGPLIKEALRSHPTLSLALDVDDLFDPVTGIYSNSLEQGDLWERQVSVELFDFPHGQTTQLLAGLRMQGNASRAYTRPKHNMRLAFRRSYGAGSLHFPVFPGRPANDFNNLILRGQNGDSWIHPSANQRERAQYIRDQWHRDVQVAMGHQTLNQGHVHLYINGLYWGFYHIFDRAEAEFMAENYGGDETDYDVVQDYNRLAGQVEAIDGDLEAWDAMMVLAQSDPANPATFAALEEYVDFANLVDYLLLNFYSGNTDWDGSNWRAGRRREPGAGWQFFAWDSERTIGDSGQASLVTGTDVTDRNVANRATGLHHILRANPEYRLFFADRIQRHCFEKGILTPERAAASWMARVDEIRMPLIAEAARWGDAHRPSEPYDPEDEWMTEVNALRTRYFPVRTGIVVQQLRNDGLFPDLAPPDVDDPGGPVPVGYRLTLTPPPGTRVAVFFTTDGSDPRLTGGNVAPTAHQGNEWMLLGSTVLKARAKSGDTWSPLIERTIAVSATDRFDFVRAAGSGEPRGVLCFFTRPVDAASALVPANYVASGQPLSIRAARLLDERTVLLEVDEYAPLPFSIRIDGVGERDGEQVLHDAEQPVDLGTIPLAQFEALSWLSEPVDATLVEGQPWHWTADVAGTPTEAIRIRWFRDGVALPVSGNPWNLGVVSGTDDGMSVHAEAFFANGVFERLQSRIARLRVLPDRLPPQVVGLRAKLGLDEIDLDFHEPVDPASALAPGTFRVPGLALQAISLGADGLSASLRTGPLAAAREYLLEIRGLTDRAAVPNALDASIPFQAGPPGYTATVLADQPVRYWRFEETDGPTVWSEASGLDPISATGGQMVGAVSTDQPSLLTADPTGASLHFDGAPAQRIDLANGADLNITAAPWPEKTVEVWFRAERLPGIVGGVPEVATLYEQGAETRGLGLYLYGAETVATPQRAVLVWFAYNNTASDGPGDGWGPAFGNAVHTRFPVAVDTIHHVVAVMAGDPTDALAGSLRLYLDGQLKDTAIGVGQLYAHSGDVRLAHGNFLRHDNRSGDTGYFTGWLDELALYNTALEADRIAAHWAAGTREPVGSRFRPFVQVARMSGHLVLEFNGILQHAPSVLGPWTDLSSQSPRVEVLPGQPARPARFLRARLPSEP
ncbi:MAG: CotH kinase family protein [Verrucomicrobiales bacterium]|nr:CotH kinase family protein [Verrucomicrobiales bacterium]